MHPKVDEKWFREKFGLTVEEIKQTSSAEKLRAAIPKRASRLTRPVDCVLCGRPIRGGEMYRDGGLHNRAHDFCMPTKAEE